MRVDRVVKILIIGEGVFLEDHLTLGELESANSLTSHRKHPTSKDVAALAGVAQSTVSYVMNGSRPVSKATKDKIMAAMKKLNYQPNTAARVLRTSKTQLIAVLETITADSDATIIPPYLATIAEESRKRNFDIILSATSEGPAALTRLSGRSSCDGFIIMDVEKNDPRIEVASKLEIPSVIFGHPNRSFGLDTIYFDYEAAAKLIVDTLASAGHRHIVFIKPDSEGREDKFKSFVLFYRCGVMRARQLGIDVAIIRIGSSGWRGISVSKKEILMNCRDRLAVVSRSPQDFEPLHRILEQEHLRIGIDVSLIGVFDDPVAKSFQLPVANVSPRPEFVSRRVVDTLINRIEGSVDNQIIEAVKPLGLNSRCTLAHF